MNYIDWLTKAFAGATSALRNGEPPARVLDALLAKLQALRAEVAPDGAGGGHADVS